VELLGVDIAPVHCIWNGDVPSEEMAHFVFEVPNPYIGKVLSELALIASDLKAAPSSGSIPTMYMDWSWELEA